MSQKSVLIIEDHEESRSLYGEILRSESYAVGEAEDGSEALKYLAENPIPDLIIMDLTFPYMTAQEFNNKLKENPQWVNIPLLIISGQYDVQDQARDLKAKGFIKKPFDIDLFIETTERLTTLA